MKNAYAALLLVLLITSSCPAEARSNSNPPVELPVTKASVIELAEKYELIDLNGFAPSFGADDVEFWVKKGFGRQEIEKAFRARQEIVAKAKLQGLRIKAQGDLSYYAEAWLGGKLTQEEAIKWLLKKRNRDRTSATRPQLLTRKAIQVIAQKFNLTEKSDVAPAFEEGDVSYWESLHFSRPELEKEFGYRARVVELAKQVHYKIPTQGDLSRYAEAIRDQQMTENKLVEWMSQARVA